MSWLKAGLYAISLTGFFLSLANDVFLTPKSTVRLIGQRAEFQCRLKKEKGCTYTRFFWRHKPIFQNDTETAGKDIENGGRFSINKEGLVSSLVITDVKITDSGYFNCSVMCVDLKKESLFECSQLEVKAVPKLTLHYQTSSDDPSNLHLTCSAVGFYPPSITLSWDHTFHEVNHSILRGDPTLLQDGTYNISSTLLVKASLWSPGDEIWCVVNHSSLTQPLRKNIMQEENVSGTRYWHWYLLLLLAIPFLTCVFLLLKMYRPHRERDVPMHCADVKFGEDDEVWYTSVRHTKETKQDKKKQSFCMQKAEQSPSVKRKQQESNVNENTMNYATLNFSHILGT